VKICVIGAGAIGGLLAARLVQAGEEVSIIDVGPQLEAIRANGLVLKSHGEEPLEARPALVTDDYAAVGPQDLVILAIKANVLRAVAEQLPKLYGSDTVLLPVQNGIPWWYFQRWGGPFTDRPVETVDPGGVIAASVDPERIVGCVTYPAAALEQPGVVLHVEGNRFTLGELDGIQTERAARVAETLKGAGFKSFVIDDIRSEIWLKLWGNLSFNPISALTHATMEDICHEALTRALARRMMTEAQAVGEQLRATFRLPIEKRLEGAEKVGPHKTSMLQDVEAGRALEIEAIIGAVVELGRLTGEPTPAIDTVYALVRLLDQRIQAQHGAVQLREVA
jgi:2-dehydropantoate 2-reductase